MAINGLVNNSYSYSYRTNNDRVFLGAQAPIAKTYRFEKVPFSGQEKDGATRTRHKPQYISNSKDPFHHVVVVLVRIIVHILATVTVVVNISLTVRILAILVYSFDGSQSL